MNSTSQPAMPKRTPENRARHCLRYTLVLRDPEGFLEVSINLVRSDIPVLMMSTKSEGLMVMTFAFYTTQ